MDGTIDERLEQGISETYEKYYPLLKTCALRYVKNAATAEDLVQQAFFNAWRARERFEPGTNIQAWLCRIVVNLAINAWRRGKYEPVLYDPNSAVLVSDHQGMYEGSPEEKNALEEKLRETWQVIEDGVKERFRDVVWLSDVCGLNYKEIARELGIPCGTVMSRLYRGRRELYRARNGNELFLGKDLAMVVTES